MNNSNLLFSNIASVKEAPAPAKSQAISGKTNREDSSENNNQDKEFASVLDKQNNHNVSANDNEKAASSMDKDTNSDSESNNEDSTNTQNNSAEVADSSPPATDGTIENTDTDSTVTTSSLVNGLPFAGSLATSSDKATQNSQELDAAAMDAESDQLETSGKTIPPSGKNLPGNLHFLTNNSTETPTVVQSEENKKQMSDSAISTALAAANSASKNNSKIQTEDGSSLSSNQSLFAKNADIALSSSNTPDLINKAIIHSQQLLNAGNPQSGSSQTTQGNAPEISPAILNANNQSSLDKIVKGADLTGLDINNNFAIKSPAGSSEWNNQMGSRLRWMSNLKISSAELKLHPAELGTVEVKIITEDDQAKVSFVTNNQTAKEVIEASLPKLRDLLADSGLQLEQSDVSHESLNEDQTQQETDNPFQSENAPNDDNGLMLVRQQSLSQYDHYV